MAEAQYEGDEDYVLNPAGSNLTKGVEGVTLEEGGGTARKEWLCVVCCVMKDASFTTQHQTQYRVTMLLASAKPGHVERWTHNSAGMLDRFTCDRL